MAAKEDATKTNLVTTKPTSPSLSKVNIVKNLAIISISFLLSFTAFSGTVNIQSSIDTENQTGNTALTILNLAATISNVLLSSVVLYKFGIKWSLVISLVTLVAFPLSNFYPKWYTLYFGAFITGLGGGGPLWSSKSTYLTTIGEQYAVLSGESPEAVISRFFGIFFMTYRGSTLTGNIIESLIIQRPPSSILPSKDVVRGVCGAHYCYEDLDKVFEEITIEDNVTIAINNNGTVVSSSFYHPSVFQLYLLFGVYALCSIAAVPLAAMTDSVDSNMSEKTNATQALLSTIRHMKNPKEILLLPMAFLSGVTYGFITADYCVGFITCSTGINNIGFIMAMFGVAAGISSVISGLLVKYIGRQVIFAFGGLCNALALIGMLVWSPDSDTSAFLYIFAGLWGIANAVWTSQLVAFMGYVFRNGNKEAAFVCNYTWQMTGNCLWHAFSRYSCLYTQLYVIAAILMIGMMGYITMELMLWKEEIQAKKCNSHAVTI